MWSLPPTGPAISVSRRSIAMWMSSSSGSKAKLARLRARAATASRPSSMRSSSSSSSTPAARSARACARDPSCRGAPGGGRTRSSVELLEPGSGWFAEAAHRRASYGRSRDLLAVARLTSCAGELLVTGATGKVGNAVARRLVERGDEVVALVRDVGKARELLPAEVELAPGDVTDPASVREAAGRRGRVQLHGHLTSSGSADPTMFERVNAVGALNVVAAARQAGVRRARPHLDLRRLPRRARRHGARGPRRRLPEGHGLRALQAARRGARARRGPRTGSRS